MEFYVCIGTLMKLLARVRFHCSNQLDVCPCVYTEWAARVVDRQVSRIGTFFKERNLELRKEGTQDFEEDSDDLDVVNQCAWIPSTCVNTDG